MRLHSTSTEEDEEESSRPPLTLETADNIYLYHQNYDWEQEALTGYYPDLMARSEIIHEFPFSVLYRVADDEGN